MSTPLLLRSGAATATTNLFGSPTLAFNDGGNRSDRGIMRINGTPDIDVEFGLAISGQSKDLPTDQLPVNFTFNPPPNGAPHTFVLKDDSGTMLLGFLSFRQVRPVICSIERTGVEVGIVWSSVNGKPYVLEFSTNLESWTVIRNDLVELPQTTSLVDNLAARFPENIPAMGYYRIREHASRRGVCRAEGAAGFAKGGHHAGRTGQQPSRAAKKFRAR